jgi:hypothetical protein
LVSWWKIIEELIFSVPIPFQLPTYQMLCQWLILLITRVSQWDRQLTISNPFLSLKVFYIVCVYFKSYLTFRISWLFFPKRLVWIMIMVKLMENWFLYNRNLFN